jgi:competence protein ComEC
METKTKNLLWWLILPLACLTTAVFVALTQTQPDFLLHAHFYDVGQGDGTMIQTYLGHQIVIDGGPSNAILKDLGHDLPFFDRTIDLLILTHPHADHVTGLVDILKRYKVKTVLLPDVLFNSSAYQEFLKLIDEHHVQKIYAHTGQRIWLDPATVFDVYFPASGETDITQGADGFGQAATDVNDTSIVGKLSFGKTRILFTGDAGTNIEHSLIGRFNLQADILKVGHHGSKYSTQPEFLQAVAPKFGVIEVGAGNTYGHPTPQTLDNLAVAHVQTLRTDQDHNIEFISDGSSLYMK